VRFQRELFFIRQLLPLCERGYSPTVHSESSQIATFKLFSRTHMTKQIWVRSLALGAIVATSLEIGIAIGAQPHMDASLALLRNARTELAAATPNKGGHREKALGLIDQAIDQVREGITFAATH